MKPIIFLVASSLCAGASEYTITELPACAGYVQTLIGGITERGAVAWSCWDGFQAEPFLSNKQGIQSFGLGFETYMRGINRHEHIVGWVQDGNFSRAVRWSDGQAIDLGSFGGRWAYAMGINDRGDIVGGASIPDGSFDEPIHPFLHRNGVFTDLGTFGQALCQATAINNKGTILLDFNGGFSGAMGFYEDGALRIAPRFGDSPLTVGQAINEAGSVAGIYLPGWEDGHLHAFFYRDGQFVNLGRPDELFAEARSINENDQVVGSWGKEIGAELIQGGFLYAQGVRTEVQDLLPPNSGWQIVTAECINDQGQIVGAGVFENQTRPYILTPVKKNSK